MESFLRHSAVLLLHVEVVLGWYFLAVSIFLGILWVLSGSTLRLLFCLAEYSFVVFFPTVSVFLWALVLVGVASSLPFPARVVSIFLVALADFRHFSLLVGPVVA